MLQPRVSALARSRTSWPTSAAKRRRDRCEPGHGPSTSTTTRSAKPIRNALAATLFGDAHLTDLCPANPDVRAYVRALTADIASKGVATVVAESLHFHGLEHGFHHERYFIELGAFGRYLLGLCFCEHCMAAARRRGVQAESLRTEARRELERRFDRPAEPEEPELVRDRVGAFAGGELAAYIEGQV